MTEQIKNEGLDFKWEAASLVRSFYEPGKVFEEMSARPRFILAWIVVIVFASSVNFFLINKVGFENIIRARIESSSQTADMSSEQKDQIVEMQNKPIVRGIAQVTVPLAILVFFAVGGLYYWFGANAMGGRASFPGALSVWVYSSFAPTVVLSAANLVVLFLKPASDLPIDALEKGLLNVSPAMFLGDGVSKPLVALLGALDLFSIWGWTLAAIGLQKTAKLPAGAAWGVVILLALFGVMARVVAALWQ